MRSILAPIIAGAALLCVQPAAQASVEVNIDLSTQTMHVSSASGADYEWAVSTGRPGHRTPTGVYHPQRMYVMTHSNKYDDAPMPHAIFFTGGYAIHGTNAVARLGGVASHGCVRLAPGNAATLFDMVKHEGATIIISGQAPGRDVASAEPERHRTGHRLAMAMRQRFREEPLAFAPHRRSPRSLQDWANNPIGNLY
jgi:L,D-transpeptidase catalytic domain